MPDTNVIPGNLTVMGTVSAGALQVPSNAIANANITAGVGNYVDGAKLRPRRRVDVELFGPTTTVAALTKWLTLIRGATGTLVSVHAAIAVVATGADRTVTVDIQKSTGAGAFATVLSATIGFTNASAIRTHVAGTFSSTSLVVGDILQVVVTVAGAAGAQATGLTLTLLLDEDPV